MNDSRPARPATRRSALAHHFRLALAGTILALMVGCTPLREFFSPSAPDLPPEWSALLDEVRAFQKRIGFRETDNFRTLSQEQHSYPFCGFAPPLVLPYSYEDPVIDWREVETEEECRELAGNADAYYGNVEAIGEIGTPVTLAMVESKLDRFLYLVIHEDCHDQYDLPYGVEEALCNVLAYQAMAQFSTAHYGSFTREARAIRRYAALESKRTRLTREYYEQLAALYERHARGGMADEVLLHQRSVLLTAAQRALDWGGAPFNNIVLASHMTYSRHYPAIEAVFEHLAGDLARAVAFFSRVDKARPTPAAVMQRERIRSEQSVEFVRAYEAAVMETVRRELAGEPRRR